MSDPPAPPPLLREYGVPEAGTVEALDRLVVMAAAHVDAPYAALSLLDGGTERLLARSGLALDAVPATGSPAAYAVAAGGLLVVPDCAADARFTEHPLVSGPPRLRFYAAAPVTSADGVPLGVLAVADSALRPQPAPEALQLLADLAAVASDLLELRRQVGRQVELDQARFHLAAIIDSSDDAILSKTLGGTILSWNAAAEKLYGYAAEEVVGRSMTLLLPPERHDEEREVLARIARGEVIDHVETERLRKDGTVLPLSLRISPIYDPDGQVVAASTIARDVRARRQADQLRFQLAAIVDSSSDAILSKGLDGTILTWNAGAQKLYGYTAEEIVGQHISALLPPDRHHEVADILARVRRGGAIEHFETERRRKDGTLVPVSVTISPIRDGQGTVVAASTIARDVSEHRRLQAELEAARDEARIASRMKSDFLAMMSHEIRTPMNGVIGMTGLLLDTDLDPLQREYAETVRGSGEALLSIINDILDFSKIEAGKMSLETIDFDLRTVIEEAADLLAAQAHGKGLELSTVVRPGVTSEVRGDPGRLRQVLLNLLGNAVKFTAQGEVVLQASTVEETPGDMLVRLEVIDTGIGIPPDQQAQLFLPFAQADSSTTRSYGGTGLGLAISKQLVELMGGSLRLESHPGQGSTFVVTVRLAKQPPGTASPPPRRDLNGLRVLIVDDNATNRTILQHQTGAWGMSHGCAEGGRQALEMLRGARAGGDPYDVALLDMEMPEMDGLDLAKAIRADPALAGTHLVLLTSSGVRGTAEQAREAGLSAYLTKPVRESQLYDCLASVVTGTAQPARLITRHTISEGRARARPRVLVADDNAVNQKVAVAMLARIGYRADVVADGVEALEAIGRIDYGAVLMDCQMPRMDGFEATAEIRRREAGSRRLPVIAMTAAAMKSDQERCLAAGMDDYIAKPARPEDLAAVLARWVPRADEPPPSAPGPAAAAAAGQDEVLELSRLQELRELIGGDGDPYLPLADLLLDQLDQGGAELRAAVESADPDAVARAAHALRGSAGNLGAVALVAVFAELELLGRAGKPPGPDLLAQLEREERRYRQAVDALRDGTSSLG